MIVVSNAGPLIALAQIERLALLGKLFGKIHISQAVYAELLSCRTEIDAAQFIVRHDVRNDQLVLVLRERLDAGESETIVLADELNADLVLMDEARGRRVCESRSKAYTGTLGVLLLAKDRNLIAALQPLLDKLGESGFYMSNSLYETTLRLAGEVV